MGTRIDAAIGATAGGGVAALPERGQVSNREQALRISVIRHQLAAGRQRHALPRRLEPGPDRSRSCKEKQPWFQARRMLEISPSAVAAIASKPRLKAAKDRLRFSWLASSAGSSIAHGASVSVNAWKAGNRAETVIETVNRLQIAPTEPLANAIGMKTAVSTSVMSVISRMVARRFAPEGARCA
jgi:hypothetical protein